MGTIPTTLMPSISELDVATVESYHELPPNGPTGDTPLDQYFYIIAWNKLTIWNEEKQDWRLIGGEEVKRLGTDKENDRRGAVKAQELKSES